MNLDIRILTPHPARGRRRRVERRLRLRLGRWSGRLGRITVRIEDRALFSAGPDKVCSIRVQLLSSGKAIGRRTEDSDVINAIEYTIDGIGRSMDRELGMNGRKSVGESPS